MPEPPALDGLPIATAGRAATAARGYTFEGYRNADGSVGTATSWRSRTTVQCVAGVARVRGQAHQGRAAAEVSRTSTTWSALEHTYGCGVAIDAPDAVIPIRTLRNIACNPNFGGEVMVVSLGCEKLQPERLLPPARCDHAQAPSGEPDVDVLPAGRGPRRLQSMVDVDHATGRGAPGAAQRAPPRDRARPPSSSSACSAAAATRSPASPPTRRSASAADLLVRAGATVMFSEVTEVRDGIDQLTARAANAGGGRAR